MSRNKNGLILLVSIYTYMTQLLIWGGQHSIFGVRIEGNETLHIDTSFDGVDQPQIIKIVYVGSLLENHDDPKKV